MPADAFMLEKTSLHNIYHLLNRCCECLSLWKLLCEHQLHLVARNLDQVVVHYFVCKCAVWKLVLLFLITETKQFVETIYIQNFGSWRERGRCYVSDSQCKKFVTNISISPLPASIVSHCKSYLPLCGRVYIDWPFNGEIKTAVFFSF